VRGAVKKGQNSNCVVREAPGVTVGNTQPGYCNNRADPSNKTRSQKVRSQRVALPSWHSREGTHQKNSTRTDHAAI
jgi:hypothetical protein